MSPCCLGSAYLFGDAECLKQQPLVGARLTYTCLTFDNFVQFFYIGSECALQNGLCALAGFAALENSAL